VLTRKDVNPVSVMLKDILYILNIIQGYAVAQLVETLRYKPEGRGFDSR
jgi:hypothetical protein